MKNKKSHQPAMPVLHVDQGVSLEEQIATAAGRVGGVDHAGFRQEECGEIHCVPQVERERTTIEHDLLLRWKEKARQETIDNALTKLRGLKRGSDE